MGLDLLLKNSIILYEVDKVITLNQLMSQVKLPIQLINAPVEFNNAIKSITIMESPEVKKWLQGGEFILTSSKTFTTDFETQVQLLKDLVTLKAVGLAVKISNNHFYFSETALAYAKKENFPIFTIPDNVTYLTIMDQVNYILFTERETTFLKENLAKYLLTTQIKSASLKQLEHLAKLSDHTKVTVLHVGPNIDWFQTSPMISQKPNYWKNIQQLLLLLIQRLDNLVEKNQLTDYLYTNDINSISIILISENKTDKKELLSAVENVNQNYLSAIKDDLIVYYGLSDNVSVYNIVEGYRQATFAHKINQFICADSPILIYSTVEFYDVMNSLSDTEIANHLMNHLKPIADNKLLMATLQTFFRNNEQLMKTSEELFININTLRYRLKKIKVLTGLDYNNTSDKLKMFLGIVHFELNKMK